MWDNHMWNKMPGRAIIIYILMGLALLFIAQMDTLFDLALVDLPIILRRVFSLIIVFFMFLGIERVIWGIVVLLQRTRPQFYEFLVTKIFGPKQLIFIGAIMLAISAQFVILLFFSMFLIMFLDLTLHIPVSLARELLFSIVSALSFIFKTQANFMCCATLDLLISIILIRKGNEQLKAIEQNQYYIPQVIYPPINQHRS